MTVSACVHVIELNGMAVRESSWEDAQDEVAHKASEELSCPIDELEVLLVRVDTQDPVQVAARGCGREVTYSRSRGVYQEHMRQASHVRFSSWVAQQ